MVIKTCTVVSRYYDVWWFEMLLITCMIPDQYPNFYKALEIYTGYFNSLDDTILFSYPSGNIITRDYCICLQWLAYFCDILVFSLCYWALSRYCLSPCKKILFVSSIIWLYCSKSSCFAFSVLCRAAFRASFSSFCIRRLKHNEIRVDLDKLWCLLD